MNDILSKLCPTTIFLNVGAIGVSLSDVELGLKILVYVVTVFYTIVKITKELKEWKKK